METEECKASLQAALENGLGSGVLVAVGSNQAAVDSLHPEELVSISRSVPKRQAEFAAGRIYARHLLGQLGHPAAPLIANKDRSPAWPRGITGSITHDASYCAVAVAPQSVAAAIGIDIESPDTLEMSLMDTICTAAEIAWLERQPKKEQSRILKLFFSAKESVYKCQHHLSKTMLDFQEVQLSLDLSNSTFAARILLDSRHEALPDVIHGFTYQGNQQILTGCRIPGL